MVLPRATLVVILLPQLAVQAQQQADVADWTARRASEDVGQLGMKGRGPVHAAARRRAAEDGQCQQESAQGMA